MHLGCAISLERLESGSEVGGSEVKTSMAQPARWPEVRAERRADSSMIPPRATLRIRAPRFMLMSSSVDIIPRVEASIGVCIVRKST